MIGGNVADPGSERKGEAFEKKQCLRHGAARASSRNRSGRAVQGVHDYTGLGRSKESQSEGSARTPVFKWKKGCTTGKKRLCRGQYMSEQDGGGARSPD